MKNRTEGKSKFVDFKDAAPWCDLCFVLSSWFSSGGGKFDSKDKLDSNGLVGWFLSGWFTTSSGGMIHIFHHHYQRREKFECIDRAGLNGLVVWFLLRVQEVPGSNPGWAPKTFCTFAHILFQVIDILLREIIQTQHRNMKNCHYCWPSELGVLQHAHAGGGGGGAAAADILHLVKTTSQQSPGTSQLIQKGKRGLVLKFFPN